MTNKLKMIFYICCFILAIGSVLFFWFYDHDVKYVVDIICISNIYGVDHSQISCFDFTQENSNKRIVVDTNKIFIHPITKKKYHVVFYVAYLFKGLNGHDDIIVKTNRSVPMYVPFGLLKERINY